VKNLDIMVVDEFDYPSIALEKNGEFIIYDNFTDMVYGFTQRKEVKELACEWYIDAMSELSPREIIAPDLYMTQNIHELAEWFGYKIVRAHQDLGDKNDKTN